MLRLAQCARVAVAVASLCGGCARTPRVATTARVGQWIWTRTDLARFAESVRVRPDLDAAVFVGSVSCDVTSGRLRAQAGLSATAPQMDTVTAVIRFEDGLYFCRRADDQAGVFDAQLDSAVSVLRARIRATHVAAMQLDYDAPQRSLRGWSRSVAYLRAHALRNDSIWITSLIAQLREPVYGELFRDVVSGHVLQVFDTGEPATETQVNEAIRLARRAGLPFRLGLGAFERDTRSGPTEHRAWFAAVPRFAAVRGYQGVWVFPAGRSWISLVGDWS
jgi:hypothetical protein